MKKFNTTRIMRTIKESGAWLPLITVTIVTTVASFINAAILQWMALAINESNATYWWMVIAGMIANTIFDALAAYCQQVGTHIAFHYMRNVTITHLLNVDAAVYTSIGTDTIDHTMGQLHRFCMWFNNVMQAIKDVIVIIATICALSLLRGVGWRALIMAAMTLVHGLLIFKASKKWIEIDDQVDGIQRQCGKEITGIVMGFQEIRTMYKAGDREERKTKAFSTRTMNLKRKRSVVSSIWSVTANVFDSVMSLIALGYFMWFAKDIPAAIAVTAVMYVWRLCEPTNSLAENLSSISENLAGLKKYNELMDYENKVPAGDVTLTTFQNEIRLDDVSFSYKVSDTVLNHISLVLERGKHYGFCGKSGGGKSTICGLLSKMYSADSGKITIDGININDITNESLRKHIGYVGQAPHIFDGTILSNLRYGKPDASMSEIREACTKAGILGFIENQADGFMSKVGPGGIRLSGGEKQRLAIARVILMKPEILILDEATAALDNETEELVQREIDKMVGVTVISVAHRLSTIKNFDKIFVIDNHEIAEEGTHEELLSRNGKYASMWKKVVK